MASKQQGIGIKRAGFEKAFNSEFGFNFSFGKPSDGQPNRLGRLHHCTVQLIGATDNLTSAGLILPLSQEDPLTVIRARKYLNAFFALVPGGENGAAWAEQNIFEAVTEKEMKVTAGDGLIVTLGGIATTDGLVMTLMVSR